MFYAFLEGADRPCSLSVYKPWKLDFETLVLQDIMRKRLAKVS